MSERSAGSVDRDGHPLSALPEAARRGLTSYVPQSDCARCDGTGYARDDDFALTRRQTFCDCPRGVYMRQRDEQMRRADRVRAREEMRRTLDASLAFEEEERTYRLESYPSKGDAAYRQVRAFLKTWNWRRNLILRGNVGSGKTGLMVSLLHALRPEAEEQGRSMIYLTAIEFYDKLKRAMTDSKAPGGASFEVALDRYRHCALLALDDIGKENRTHWTSERLFDVLNDRHRHGRPTWLTSNLIVEQRITGSGVIAVDRLEEWLDSALWSRLQQRGDVIEFTGPDLRR